MRGFNAIREQQRTATYEEESPDDDGGDDVPESGELLERDTSVAERLAPSTRLGWILAFIGTVILVVLINFLGPLIPPFFFSPLFLGGVAVLLLLCAVYIAGRLSVLSTLEELELVTAKVGGRTVEKIGKVDGQAGKDPLFKELDSLGFAALSPTYKKIDDKFDMNPPLANKTHRKTDDDEWDEAKGRLDHTNTADGSSALFNRVYVAHAGGVNDKGQSPDFEWAFTTPQRPDMDSARQIMHRDQQLREEVIPALWDTIETIRENKEQIRRESMDRPLVGLDEIGELMEQIQPNQQQVARGGRSPAAQQALAQTDQEVSEDLEQYDENGT